MKNVLFIAFYFNQENEIASKRLRSLAKYLPEYNWMPIVIVPNINGIDTSKNKTEFKNIEIIETEYVDMLEYYTKPFKKNKKEINIKEDKENKTSKNKEKLIHIAGELFAYPDGMKYWIKPTVKVCEKIIKEKNIDAIISSSFPVSTHIIAKKLSDKYNIPWIADLRDLWCKNPYIHHNKLRNYFEMRLENKTFKKVDALTVTSNRTKTILSNLHPDREVYSIENGYDKEFYEKLDYNFNYKKHDKLKITYAGRLYYGKRDPTILFKAISELSNENKINKDLLEINFYGDSTNIKEFSRKYNLKDIVKIHGFIPHKEVLIKEKESDILLLLSWNNSKESIFIPGKIFEYMGLKKPVLSIGYKEGGLKDIINETDIGYHTDNIAECKKILLKYYNEFIENGEINYNGNKKIENYTTEKMAKNFSDVLNKITENNKI
ncbi:glycosyl transferase GT4 family protein [Methanobrevibacter sp. 87.7]|uniref:glycosyltransferase n=1 Tax=Methanobrevibacter sp. 87.7 TaxID=387957 RepID=UPI000B509B4E|nr:glycosyltransferase [Methanobrevibacter sp. 87.7]OWT33212.1 glycosyl transferase GT4 family protein [Methanobrevibacter sp. 87.7]